MSLVSCADNGPDSGDNSTGSDTVQTVDFDYDAGLTSEGLKASKPPIMLPCRSIRSFGSGVSAGASDEALRIR